MGKSSRGVPQKVNNNSAAVAANNTQHRVRALVDQVLDVFAREAAAGKRDPAQQLADDFYAVPPTARPDFMAQLLKLAGIVPGQGQGSDGKISFNFNGLFAGAAAAAAERQGDNAVVIDGCEDESDGVHDGYTPSQAIDW